MGNAFQDQLLKAGLVNKKQVKKANHDKRVRKKNQEKNPQGPSKIQLEQIAEKNRIKKLNKKQYTEQQHQEKITQIKQLIEQNRIQQDPHGNAYNFIDENKIKRIYIANKIADQISCGQIAIIKSDTGYEIVPRKIAQQISARDKKTVLVLHNGKPAEY